MTITDILVKLAAQKPMTQPTLYAHLRALKIKPLGKVRQCPQHYPDDTADRVLNRLGFEKHNGPRKRNRRQLTNAR